MKKATLFPFAIILIIGMGDLTAQTNSFFCQELSWSPDGKTPHPLTPSPFDGEGEQKTFRRSFPPLHFVERGRG